MKKMRIALASMLVAAGITATAGAANFTNCADRLKDVGLFQGTNQGYQLDKAPTRAELRQCWSACWARRLRRKS